MNDIYDWKGIGDRYYYYNKTTGKIVAHAGKIALQEIFYSIAYIGEVTFTVNDEKHLGQYISLESAKNAAQLYWDVQSRTLIGQ